MRETVESLKRDPRRKSKSKPGKEVGGANAHPIDVALTEKPSTSSQARVRGIWRDHIIARWKDDVPGLEEPVIPAQRDQRDKVTPCQEMWQALRRVDHHLQGLPEADWPVSLGDVHP